MALQTYTDLLAAVADFLNRQDLTAVIPTFVTLAEAQFNRTLRTRDMQARVITTVADRYTQLPDDFRGMRKDPEVVASPPSRLDSVSADELQEFRDRNSDATGRPRRFTIIGDSMEVEPTPDTGYTVRVAYWAAIPALSTAKGGINWLMTKHPDAYLYTSLLQSAPYLKDDDRIAVWDGARQRAIDEIMLEDQRSSYGGTPVAKTRPIG